MMNWSRVLVASVAVLAGGGASVVAAQPAADVHGSWTADSKHDWRVRDGEPRLQVNLAADDDRARWGAGIRRSELESLPLAAWDGTARDVRFSWTREAGTFRLAGSFDSGRGAGTFIFTPDPDYVSDMARLGCRDLPPPTLVRLAMVDVTQAFVGEVHAAGHAGLPLDELVRFCIHRVTGA
jgi:hypothetical protein